MPFPAEISVLIVDDDSKCNQIIDRAPRCLKKIISIREVRMATMQRARSRAIEIIRFDEIERVGAQKMFEEVVSYVNGQIENVWGEKKKKK